MSVIHTQELSDHVKLHVVRTEHNGVGEINIFIVPDVMSQMNAPVLRGALSWSVIHNPGDILDDKFSAQRTSDVSALTNGQKLPAKDEVLRVTVPLPETAVTKEYEATSLEQMLSALKGVHSNVASVNAILKTIDVAAAVDSIGTSAAATAPAQDGSNLTQTGASDSTAVDLPPIANETKASAIDPKRFATGKSSHELPVQAENAEQHGNAYVAASKQGAETALAAARAKVQQLKADDVDPTMLEAVRDAVTRAELFAETFNAQVAKATTSGSIINFAKGASSMLKVSGSKIDQQFIGDVMYAQMQAVVDAINVDQPADHKVKNPLTASARAY